MAGEGGILGLIAALLLGSASKYAGSEPGYKPPGIPYPDVPVPPAAPPAAQPETPGTIQFGVPKDGKIGFTSPEPTPVFAPGISERTFVTTTPPAAPAAPVVRTTPVTRTTGTIAQQLKTGSWMHFAPPGYDQTPIPSRPPTEEEANNGLGCPEVPGIWDAEAMNPAYRYCANPDCPSNKSESVVMGGEIQNVPATPAVLEAERGADGIIRYFCRVCRTYQ